VGELADELRAAWQGRSPEQRRIVAGAAVAVLVWLVLVAYTRSALTAMIITLVATGLVFAVATRRRAPGDRTGPPRVEPTGGSGQDPVDTFGQAIRGLDQVLVPGQAGHTYAPTHIEIVFSRSDLAALWQRMESEFLEEVALTEYLGLVEQRDAALQNPHELSVTIIGESGVPDGAFLVRQRRPGSTGGAGTRPSRDGGTTPANAPTSILGRGRRPVGPQAGPAQPGTVALPSGLRDTPRSGPRPAPLPGPRLVPPPGPRPGPLSDPRPAHPSGPRPSPSGDPAGRWREPSGPPRLTLRTGSAETSTTASPATAGRAATSDLRLPNTDTISREHAVFTYEDGRWWVRNVGRNGLCVNNQPIGDRHPLADRDQLRWGTRADAPVSTVWLTTGRPGPEQPESAPSAQW
jgi:hypothetical protein